MDNRIILLVEDDPDDAALTVRAFRKNNVTNEIKVVSDGVEALDYLFGTGLYEGRDTRRPPALVLLDLNLPRMGGIEVLKRLREDGKTRMLPIVVLTSSTEERDVIDSYLNGANSYVRKPVDFNQFAGVANQLGLYWLALNEPPPRSEG